MEIVNLTPHSITIHGAPGGPVEVPPSGGVARCASRSEPAGEAAGVPLVRTVYGEVVGLPAPVAGTLLIVSALVRQAAPGRADLASPGEAVRDGEGRVVGCRGLVVT
jgi:hypothetical protein